MHRLKKVENQFGQSTIISANQDSFASLFLGQENIIIAEGNIKGS